MLHLLHQLLAPAVCAGCATPGPAWCARCASMEPTPTRRDIGLVVHSRYPFEGPVRRLIIDWKDEGGAEASRHVIAWFRASILPVLALHPTAVLVPVPASPASRRRRGGPVLAEAVRAAVPEVEMHETLVSACSRRDQTGLGRVDRARNLAASMRWIGVADRPIILVDDLITTGATLRESARAIRAGGGLPVAACTIAFRERGDPVARSREGLRLP